MGDTIIRNRWWNREVIVLVGAVMNWHLPSFSIIRFVPKALVGKFLQGETAPQKNTRFPILRFLLHVNMYHTTPWNYKYMAINTLKTCPAYGQVETRKENKINKQVLKLLQRSASNFNSRNALQLRQLQYQRAQHSSSIVVRASFNEC